MYNGNPRLRAVIGVVVIAVALVLHMDFVAIGGLVLALAGAGQLLYTHYSASRARR